MSATGPIRPEPPKRPLGLDQLQDKGRIFNEIFRKSMAAIEAAGKGQNLEKLRERLILTAIGEVQKFPIEIKEKIRPQIDPFVRRIFDESKYFSLERCRLEETVAAAAVANSIGSKEFLRQCDQKLAKPFESRAIPTDSLIPLSLAIQEVHGLEKALMARDHELLVENTMSPRGFLRRLIALSELKICLFFVKLPTEITDDQLRMAWEIQHRIGAVWRVLDASECSNLTNGAGASLARMNLFSLDLTDCDVGDTLVSHLAFSKRLTSLSLGGTNVTTKSGPLLAKIQTLRTLDLSSCSELDNSIGDDLAQLPYLQTLNLSTSQWLENSFGGSILNMKNLKSLDLSYCGNLTDDFGAVLPRTSIRRLNLENCHQLTDYIVTQYIDDRMDELQAIKLGGRNKISPEVRSAMDQKYPWQPFS